MYTTNIKRRCVLLHTRHIEKGFHRNVELYICAQHHTAEVRTINVIHTVMNRTRISITPWFWVSFQSRSQKCRRLLTRSIHRCVARSHSQTTQQVFMEFDTGGNVTENSRGIPNSSSLKWVTMKRSWSGLRHYSSIRLEGMNKQDQFITVRILMECL